MDYLWSPWRFQYISEADKKTDQCVFCRAVAQNRDEEHFIFYRGVMNFLILNLYPYTTGHLLIVPYRHVATLAEAGKEELHEMIELAQRCQVALAEIYKPDGFNLGINLGRAAGAGVADHFHMHVLPRWTGDANFMSVVGETRVIPEDLTATYKKLKAHF